MFLQSQNNFNIIYTAEDKGKITKVDLRSRSNEAIYQNKILKRNGSTNQTTRAAVKNILQPPNGSGYSLVIGGQGLVVGEIDLRYIRQTDNGNNFIRTWSPAYSPTSKFSSIITSNGISMNCSLSLSGLALSKDGRKLLTSYQGDQIYIFDYDLPFTTSDELAFNSISSSSSSDDSVSEIPPISCLGGHINHATFLKSVSFFGPNDDYVIGGCDSGGLWIWDAQSGYINQQGYPDDARIVNIFQAGIT